MFIEVLTEGAYDTPVVREVLTRHFGLSEHLDFRIHPHRGRGKLPVDPLAQPDPKHRGLFDQLPAKLRGFGKYMNQKNQNFIVLVLADVDQDDCVALLHRLKDMLDSLPSRPPRVLFRLAIKETESWFIADTMAVKAAYPKAKLAKLAGVEPDGRIGAWEKLAECLGVQTESVSGADKFKWAEKIAPHLNLIAPYSPSLGKLISGLSRELGHAPSPFGN